MSTSSSRGQCGSRDTVEEVPGPVASLVIRPGLRGWGWAEDRGAEGRGAEDRGARAEGRGAEGRGAEGRGAEGRYLPTPLG